MSKQKTERHASLIDSLQTAMFPFQESEFEQESFTPEGRKRVDDWLDVVLESDREGEQEDKCECCGEDFDASFTDDTRAYVTLDDVRLCLNCYEAVPTERERRRIGQEQG